MQGGTFTVSNGGTFGSLMGTPIINPPQSAILGMHSIINRPVVRGDEIVARPMMYLALTYDHRLLDGKDAVLFLKRIQTLIENPKRMLLEIWFCHRHVIIVGFYLNVKIMKLVINEVIFLRIFASLQ